MAIDVGMITWRDKMSLQDYKIIKTTYMLFTSTNKVTLRMVSSRDADDTIKQGEVWVKSGIKTKWTKLYFVDDMGEEYQVDIKGIPEAKLYKELEGKDGLLELKIEKFGKDVRVRMQAFTVED